MDIGTIKARLKQGRYKGATDFAADVHLVFFNAMLYNSNPNHAAWSSVLLSLTRDRRAERAKCRSTPLPHALTYSLTERLQTAGVQPHSLKIDKVAR